MWQISSCASMVAKDTVTWTFKRYKDCSSDIGKWLNIFFCLPFLQYGKVEDASVEDTMSDSQSDGRSEDYSRTTVSKLYRNSYIEEQVVHSTIEKVKLEYL